MKESTSITVTTKRSFSFTRGEVETLLRREMLGGDVQAKIEFTWADEINYSDINEAAVVAVNTVTEHK